MGNRSHPGNPSGLRGTGSKERVGATVARVALSKEARRALRIVCLQLYGKADKETVNRHVGGLILAEWSRLDQIFRAKAEESIQASAQPGMRRKEENNVLPQKTIRT